MYGMLKISAHIGQDEHRAIESQFEFPLTQIKTDRKTSQIEELRVKSFHDKVLVVLGYSTS